MMKTHDPRLARLAGRLLPDDMENSPPLQAADVFCWHAWRLHESGTQDTNLSWLWHGNPNVRAHTWSEGRSRQTRRRPCPVWLPAGSSLCHGENMKRQPQMIEGPEASARFVQALKAVLSVPRARFPNPFGKKSKKKGHVTPKGSV